MINDHSNHNDPSKNDHNTTINDDNDPYLFHSCQIYNIGTAQHCYSNLIFMCYISSL